mmetsp:Transcript_48812/g.129372  ORF Transcript_48812/g.129372 Transcript_48812/m.129372 type:complete len:402 (-) Transcript_48812:207-1412(-)
MSCQQSIEHVRKPTSLMQFPRLLGQAVDVADNGNPRFGTGVSIKSNAECWVNPLVQHRVGNYRIVFDDERGACSTGTASPSESPEEVPTLHADVTNQAGHETAFSPHVSQLPAPLPLPPGLWQQPVVGVDNFEGGHVVKDRTSWDTMEPMKIEFMPVGGTFVLSHGAVRNNGQVPSARNSLREYPRPALAVLECLAARREEQCGIRPVTCGVQPMKHRSPMPGHSLVSAGKDVHKGTKNVRRHQENMPPFDMSTPEMNEVVSTSNGVNTRSGRARRRCHRFTCKFVFGGFDLGEDADFELVPRLIGRGGAHMRAVAEACQGKVRIRGRGSGYMEQQKGGKPPAEAGVPLQIVVSCTEKGHLEEGKRRLQTLLQNLSLHFDRYRKMRGAEPPLALYSIVEDA